MGQQQLLLIILVTIICGIATVVAINTFNSANDQANKDAVRADLAALASSAQGYFMKPEMLGGGGNSFTGFTFRSVAFPIDQITDDGLHVRNANGTYHVWSVSADSIGIYGEPITELEGSVDITSLVSDSDFFSISIKKDGITWLNTY
ncbi:hypothetical protein [Balneola vulgaris]|jgi:hypothetical protein|uniref:hypothetical protein n=1 Tax=Balneola vulgaris TaxID=287535 RepID=UPI0003744075|nr:hypothetical protein [Balneola vulgaris]